MSYQGKHRGDGRSRRTAKKLSTAAAVTGVATAAPLVGLTATPADAASTSTWEQLAQCESGGNWSINTGNGFYGGLQFTNSTWQAFGGGQYASQANYASESEQIAIAEKVLDGQGWGAWPSCSSQLGLSSSDAGGTPDTSGSSSSSDDSSDYSSSDDSSSDYSSSDDSSSSSSSSDESSDDSSSSSSSSDDSSSSSSSYHERVEADGANYTVKSGDTLAKIAASQNVDGGWKALWEQNRSLLGDNPDLIMVGEHLLVN